MERKTSEFPLSFLSLPSTVVARSHINNRRCYVLIARVVDNAIQCLGTN